MHRQAGKQLQSAFTTLGRPAAEAKGAVWTLCLARQPPQERSLGDSVLPD